MESRRLINRLGKLYPKHCAEAYDHPGRQIGRLKTETRRVLVALDFDQTIFETAKLFQPDLIITHHPFIFGTPAAVFKKDPGRRLLAERVASEIGCPIYSYHTNFDAAPGGMNDIFAAKLGLVDIYAPADEPAMRIGNLPEAMDIRVFVDFVLDRSEAGYGGLINCGTKTIRKVALVAGGGAAMYRAALSEGADIYLSGDCPHHIRRDIVVDDFNYLDLPHEIERMFIPHLKKVLLSIDPKLDILEVDHEQEAEYILH